MKRNIKLTIEYDGKNYSGWQRQKDVMTIQQKIEDVISEITRENIEVIGCSRTDSGVHAKAFVCNFITESTIPSEKFKLAINQKLPKDIVILNSEKVDLEFHSRYHSKGKTYLYNILNRQERPVINRDYVYHFNKNLDIDLMIEASKYFLGTHEFDSFKNIGSSVQTTERTIYNLNIYKDEQNIKIQVTGDGFLYNMVRIMVGTLLDVGMGKIPPNAIKHIIAAKDRTKAGRAVPAQGLYLQQVYY